MKTYDGCLSNLIKNVLFSVFLLLLVVACGSNQHGQSTGTGAIAFSIDWQNAPALAPSLTDGTLTQHALQAIISQAPLDCAAAGVATVEAVVYDSSNAVVASGGPWSCDAHSGSIAGVPAGTNWKVAIIGKDASGSILYYGETGGVSVAGDQTTNLGAITASLFTPTGVTATAGNSQINLNWTTMTGASSYNIYWSTTPGVTKITGTKIANAAKIYTHGSLTNWTPYYYVITASNSNGESKESAGVTATPTNAVPVAPANVIATASNAQSIVSWNTVTGATSYNIYWRTTTGVTKLNGTKITNPPNPYTHSSLSNWTPYYYVVTAVDSQGESIESSQVSALPPATAPAAPTGVTATPADGKNTISWTAVIGATSYNIYWSTTPGVTKATGTQISTVTSPHAHNGLTNGIGYYYVVTAVNASFGESAESTQVTAAFPETLASGLSGPYGISIDSANIYWTEYGGGTVKSMPINGGAITPLASGLVSPLGITKDATNIYWIEYGTGIADGSVKMLPISAGTVTTLASNLSYLSETIAVDSTNVYWSSDSGAIKSIPISGGSATTLATGQSSGFGIAVNSTSIYWANGGSTRGYVYSTLKSGGTVTTLGYWESPYVTVYPGTIAADSTNVYWSAYSLGGTSINKVGINGGSVTTLVSSAAPSSFGPMGPLLTVDSTNVYWIDFSGVLNKISINGGPVSILATGLGESHGLAVDSANVYWTEKLGGTIRKIPK